MNFFPLCFFNSFSACSLALAEWEKARKRMRFACRFDLDFVGLRVIVVVVVLDVADFAEINIILSLSWRASGLKAGV